jgi:hypothetical protein
MFQLNPLDLSNVSWQYLLMPLISGVIGFVISFRKRNNEIAGLEIGLDQVHLSLDECHEGLLELTASVKKKVVDDFKVIEGIDPQIEKILHAAGIRTYGQLSFKTASMIKEILDKTDPRFQMYDPVTWPRQALLAAAGEWKELKEWQTILNRGGEQAPLH